MDKLLDKYEVLKKYFGYTDFRTGQEEAIDKILAGKEVLGIMPTGAGKSLCFQVPAMLMDGITIVISPLISLMKDQVRSLTSSGIRAAYLNSSLTYPQYLKALENAYDGIYKIIYVAPERLLTPDFINFARTVDISLFVIDEAHCISQWGNDFRPSYAKIPEFFEVAGIHPNIAAFTATATPRVEQDICEMLGIHPDIVKTGYDRENLYFDVRMPDNKRSELDVFLSERKGESGIVYCNTRKNVDDIYAFLNKAGYNAAKYHAGMDDDERRKNQDRFIFEDDIVMVATNAFGMGIDKPDVRFVVHYNMPKDMESYYQEAGRAGRDGEKAYCLLLFSYQDVIIDKILIDINEYETHDTDEINWLKKQAYERLNKMQAYCTGDGCLRKYILKYFGERSKPCGNCSGCNTVGDKVDMTRCAHAVISCVSSLEREFGKKVITDVLRGRTNEKIELWNLDLMYEFGLLSDVSVQQIEAVINELIFRAFLEVSTDKYQTISVTESGIVFMGSGEKFMMRLKTTSKKKKKKVIKSADQDLIDLLKAERKKMAAVQGVPAFVICGDASITDMAAKKPQTTEEFMEVFGIGRVKAEKYGARFMKVIKNYREG